jgi:hypothetical protein
MMTVYNEAFLADQWCQCEDGVQCLRLFLSHHQGLMWWVLHLHAIFIYEVLSVQAWATWWTMGGVRWSVMSYTREDHLGYRWSSKFTLLVIGPSLRCFEVFSWFIMFIPTYNDWLRGNPVFLLQLLGCSCIPLASLTKLSMWLNTFWSRQNTKHIQLWIVSPMYIYFFRTAASPHSQVMLISISWQTECARPNTSFSSLERGPQHNV